MVVVIYGAVMEHAYSSTPGYEVVPFAPSAWTGHAGPPTWPIIVGALVLVAVVVALGFIRQR